MKTSAYGGEMRKKDRGIAGFAARNLSHSRKVRSKKVWVLVPSRLFLGLLFLSLPTGLWAADPPPEPSASSTLGQTVTNPVTSTTTTVSELVTDPDGTPTAGATAWVKTADGYIFLVKAVGEKIYNGDDPPAGFTVVSQDTTEKKVDLDADPAGGSLATLNYQVLLSSDQDVQSLLSPPSDTPGDVTPPDIVEGADGVRIVRTGDGGSNGRDGALVVPPTSGGDGDDGPGVGYTNSSAISTTNQIGIEAGSKGGKGGNGGDSYLSFWSGRDGGDGGKGGSVSVVNGGGVQVATTGTNKYGIFAYSRSGKAGNGGSGFAAPGGGTGGHSSDGGHVTVTNNGDIITTGEGAFGIYGLSVSNNGGDGGSQWGLVGQSGAGNYGGDGGTVEITNSGTGAIYTSGNYAHGIVGQSIGGSGGSSGASGNALLSLNGSADNGGNGGAVRVINDGRISTTGNDARGLFAQSIGGGGGTGGSTGGLISLGGSGSNGGSGGAVTAKNNGTGAIATTGVRSDGIFAQSVGGSGGSGSSGGGLVSVGGSGSSGGNGGAVTVENYGDISTTGDAARGIVAQSIGGGGGDGGSSGGMVSVGGSGSGGGASSTVTVKHGGAITTEGDDARGILAQSVGGGGGSGGSSGSIGVFAGVAVGGTGGSGGAGGNVNVTLQGEDANTASVIRTEGERSTGLFAQSVGGGGGAGGGAVQVSVGFGAAASVAVGGQGGAGGSGGVVTLSKGAGVSVVETTGDDATGVMLQSVGGGGGNGGYAISVAASGGPVSGSISVGVGGKGGVAGAGGDVSVGAFDAAGALTATGFEGSILTKGERSTGFFAQSVGGGGGNGGLAVSAAAGASADLSGSIGIAVGGDGGGGGDGGKVSVGMQGNITTEEAHSTGLLVQSVGGGGGNGGGSIAAALAFSGGSAGTIGVSVGGNAAAGSKGGQVTAATRSGTIATGGENSTGILVQSVGGGGGNGGYSISAGASGAGTAAGAVNVGLGGAGGGGGDGGTVKTDLQSNVNTAGQNSTGILVQSVGGGGGNGGFNIAAGIAGAGTASGAVSVGLGGNGGAGGRGGTVNASSAGAIATQGDRSSGLIAQSIGGGGGNGGFNISAAASGSGTASGGVAVGIGGSGGDGGASANVTSSHSGNVTTSGKDSTGIIAQSVGGGGGNGGLSVAGVFSAAKTGSVAASVSVGGSGGGGGNSAAVDNTVTGDILTAKEGSGGVLAQSVGGGGGNGGISVSGTISLAGTGSGAVSVGIGGSGGDGGGSGTVVNRVTGNVYTSGSDSFGVAAQSIGGGGGNGGLNVSGSISAAKDAAGALGVGIGGFGGGGGDGAAVDNTVSGYVQTLGDHATGILAQSLGGGGGNGGLNVTGTITGAKTGSGGLSVGVGGFGGDGGDGKSVVNRVTGGAVTTGAYSDGVVAQSLGGGGGNGGLNVTGAVNLSVDNGGALGVGIGGFGGGGGHAAKVESTVTTTAEHDQIGTTGDHSSAVVAQSIGGGGGNGGTNITGAVNLTGKNGAAIGVGVGGFGGGAGNGGEVVLDVTGQVVTQGNDSHGLLAQSIGGGGGNGGTNVTGSLAFTASSGGAAKTVTASIGIGGFGGDGGAAGAVNVTYSGAIVAQPRVLVPEATDPNTGATIPAHFELKEGMGSHGIAAQSIGGGGGNGGIDVSAGLSLASGKGDAYGIMVGVGGFGGKGGNADTVAVTVNGGESISSYGAGHSAVLAQSVGGGGGNGGTNVSGGIVSDSPLIVGVGGFGADAGVARNVTVTATTDLFASAADSTELSAAGIMAQSLGGGGGNGGLNVSGGLAISKESTVPSVTVGVGGFGGAGAASGDVTVNHTGNASTSGDWIHGIMAQSIAGGGGNGGMNVSGQINFADSTNSGGKTDLTIVAGVGGNAGSGANAGNVSVTNSGAVTTSGDDARGVAAQSIGGGGGTGGMNVTGVFAKNSSPLSVGVGGSGAGGGHAGTAAITRGTASVAAGKVTTDGVAAHAVEASSIGGGGGDAGMNFIGGVSLAGSDDTAGGFQAQFAIGGAGGEAGNGAAASVTNYSDVETKQENSHGIMAQSIGGGGGNANLNVAVTYEGKSDKNMGFNLAVGGGPGDGGSGATADVVHVGDIETAGSNSFGILSQSIGGGGGNTAFSIAYSKTDGGKMGISLGREGGTGGLGADVTLSSNGNVITHGEGSFGMLAQSVGNGGGNSSATSVSVDGPDRGADRPAQSAAVSVGLEGGAGGRSGNVTVDAAGFVSTDGKNAHAIFAQSVGGGGGNGGSANTFGLEAPAAALSLGGAGGTGGVSGIVQVTSSADVRTHGDDSVGILAQSVGGGGGTGGMARSGGLKSKTSGATVSVGGNGGSGMESGNVTVGNSGVVITDGVSAHGVLAQSLGGGGGNSGMAIDAVLKEEADSAKRLAVSVGGTGGDGALSGAVTVTNTGGIGTNKEKSAGIFAQSIGGGGGNADNVITAYTSGKGGGSSLSVGIGGSGGTGGAAGDVTVSNLIGAGADSGKIITVGNFSHGILAMSVGGGGGTGSTTVTAKKTAGATDTETATSVNFSLGGAGGVGGTGGKVDVTNDGQIATYGYKAHGILAESIGGGGGNGGMSISGDLAMGTKTSQTSTDKTGVYSVGGSGGNGNRSGDVAVTNSGAIEVFGQKAYGIYAQSVGGGGGDGGMAMALSRNILTNPKTDLKSSLLNIAVGGNGGDGADSGNVLVQHTGSIISHGDNSYGIFAQAVGGGGGNVGYSITNPAWMAADLAISTLVGGRDGSEGTAGTVTINTTGAITMLGKNSMAQLGQSVNGGGGNVDLFLDFSQHAVQIGDDGIELPDNGGINENVAALVKSGITLGTTAISGAVGSAIDATHIGDLYAGGKNSLGSLIQSIGGGGGNTVSEIVVDTNAQVDLELALGGTNSSGNSGGNVALNRTGDVGTTGDQSPGSAVQSIGGGGGNLTVTLSRVPAPGAQAAALAPLSGDSRAGMAVNAAALAVPLGVGSATLGADGGASSDGGAMDLTYAGDVSTAGDRSYGVIVQSIGGGGGKLDLTGFDSLQIAIGGTNGASGNGGDVSLANTGSVSTTGALSHGIIVQSIGGGGGAAFTDLAPGSIAVTPRSGNSGNGGRIDFTQTGDVAVQGERAIGILAQSLGGGGGVVDRVFADTAGGAGSSGAVTLGINGNVLAGGNQGVGVFAQSRGADGQGDISVELAAGKRIEFGPGGEGVRISGGATNLFVNRGTVAGADGMAGWAVMGEEGDERIENSGVIRGQVDLGQGANQLVNRGDATASPGDLILLGASSNQFINEGVMTPGNMNHAQHTDMTGSFVQSATGKTFAELDFGSDMLDQLYMDGTAKLAGELSVSLLNPQLVPSGHFQKTLFSADGGVTDDGMVLVTPPSVVITYQMPYPTGYAAVLDYNVDFSPGGALGVNLEQVGDYFNRIQAAGSSPALASTVIKLLYDPTMEAYRESLSQLSPDFYGEQQAALIRSSQRFGRALADGGPFFPRSPAGKGERSVIKTETGALGVGGTGARSSGSVAGRGFWLSAEREETEHDAYDDYKSAQHRANIVTIGYEGAFGDQWTAGVGFAVEENSAGGYDGRWGASGNTEHIGAILRRGFGASALAGTLSYSWNHMNSKRIGQITTPFGTTLSRDLEALAAMLRGSHRFGWGGFYLKPLLDLGFVQLRAKSATEDGAGPTSLVLGNYERSHLWARPALGLGEMVTSASGSRFHFYAEVGYQHYFSGKETIVEAGIAGAPAGIPVMEVPIDLGSFVNGTVGIDFITARGIVFGLKYSRVFTRHYNLDLGRVTMDIPF